MGLARLNVKEIDILHFLNSIQFEENFKIYNLSTFKSYWLFLDIFFKFKISVRSISFNGLLTKFQRNNLLIALQRFDDMFPNISTDFKSSIINIVTQLLEDDKEVSLNSYLKEIFKFLPAFKEVATIDENEFFIENLFRCFTITWFADVNEYEKIEKYLETFHVSKENAHSLLIKKVKDVQIDTDLVLAFNSDKDGDRDKNSALLFFHIGNDQYRKRCDLKPLDSKIINRLYGARKHGGISMKEMSLYKSSGEKYEHKSISNSIRRINKIASGVGYAKIIPDGKFKRLNSDFKFDKDSKK